MSAPAHTGRGSGPRKAEARWICPASRAEALLAAVDQFLANAAETPLADAVSQAICEIAAEGPGGVATLEAVRRKRLKRDGGFACRYVAVKWLDADGQIHPLSQPVPARDRIPDQMARIVAERPEQFPHGPTAFFEHERPLIQARTGEFQSILAAQIRQELKSLPTDAPAVSHPRLASLLDLSSSYRHQAQVRQAHAAALEKIDAGDVGSLCEFLTTVAGQLPLSGADFERFVELARTDWMSEAEQDVLLRGRIVTLGLEGKPHLLRSWVTPIARELAVRGLLPRLISRYKSEHRPLLQPAPIRPRGASAARESVLEDDTQELVASETGIHILEGTPEPERMDVLRNYVRCATVCAVVSLEEALRIAQAHPDVPGHRQHVIHLFHDEGWVMSPRRHGEPVFEKRAAPAQFEKRAAPAQFEKRAAPAQPAASTGPSGPTTPPLRAANARD